MNYADQIKPWLHRHRFAMHFFQTEAYRLKLNNFVELGGWLGVMARNLQTVYPWQNYIAYEAVTEYAKMMALQNPTLDVRNRTVIKTDQWKPYFYVNESESVHTSSILSTEHDGWVKKAIGSCLEPIEFVMSHDWSGTGYKSNIEGCDVDVLEAFVEADRYPACMLVEIWPNYHDQLSKIYPELAKQYNIPTIDLFEDATNSKGLMFMGLSKKKVIWYHPNGEGIYKEINFNVKKGIK